MQISVYILRCADGSYYTGSTRKDPEARLWEHTEGILECWTKSRRPVTMVFAEEFGSLIEAFTRERQIKGWSRRKKEALIRYDYESLPALSKSKK